MCCFLYDDSVQFSSVAQSCPTLCDPMNCSTPGLPVHHQLPEFTQTHVHRVSDATQPSHPLSSPSPAPNPSQHQGLFQRVNSSHEVAKVLGVSALASVLPMNTQDWSALGWTGWIGEVWQNVVHWRREWQTTSIFLPWEQISVEKANSLWLICFFLNEAVKEITFSLREKKGL